MTSQQVREDLTHHARRLVTLGLVDHRDVSINPDAGTVSDMSTGELLHYESGVTVVWAPWRPQYWEQA